MKLQQSSGVITLPTMHQQPSIRLQDIRFDDIDFESDQEPFIPHSYTSLEGTTRNSNHGTPSASASTSALALNKEMAEV